MKFLSCRRIFSAAAATVALLATGLATSSVVAGAAAGSTLDLRVLLIGDGATDPTTAAWESALSTEGVPYTEVDAAGASATAGTTAAVGTWTLTLPALSSGTTGYFNGVVIADSPADFASGQLTALDTYESTFGVDQLDGYVFPSSSLGVTEVTSGALDGTTGTLTAAGLAAFPELAGAVPFATGSYGYGATVTAGAPFTTLITNSAGDALAGTYQHPATDPQANVPELALFFNYNATQLQWLLLAPGLINWVTQGTHLGEYRNYVEMDIDDTFTPDDAWDATTHEIDYLDTDSLRMSPEDVITSAQWSAANSFRFDQLFNFGSTTAYEDGALDFAGATNSSCTSTNPCADPLLAQFQAVDPATGKPYTDDFGWISHTYDTPYLDVGCATQDYIEAELNENTSSIAAAPGATPGTGGLGLTNSTDDSLTYGAEDPQVFVPGNHSGFANLVPGNPATVDEPVVDDETASTTTPGTLATGTYDYAVTDQFTAGGGESAAYVTGPVSVTSGQSVQLQWQAICHAANYSVYRASCSDSTCSSPTGWTLIGNYYTPFSSTLPDNSSGDASPASTTSVTGAGETQLTFTDTGSASVECQGDTGYCVTAGPAAWTTPPITENAVESAWEQNPYFITAMEAVGITAVGDDASKPYPDPPTAVFFPDASGAAYSGPEYAAGQTFLDGTAQVVPRHPINIFYNASTEAQEVDEYNTLYPSTTASTFADVVNTIVGQMLQFMLTNNPEPSYVHQTNLMGILPGCTTSTTGGAGTVWPNCAPAATTGTPPATADTTGDGLLYSVLDPLLAEYHSYFNDNATNTGATPFVQLTEGQIATVLADQSAWSSNVTSAAPPVTASETNGVVTIANAGSTPAQVPVTVPTGTTSTSTAFLQPYGGDLSGWASVANGSTVTLTEATAAPPTSATPPGGSSGSGGGALAVGGAVPTVGVTTPTTTSVPITVNRHSPVFTSASKATATVGRIFSFLVSTSGYPFANFAHSVLPAGLRWATGADGKATISGSPMPATEGKTKVTITASNSWGKSKQILTLEVRRSPGLVASKLPPATA
ncbi:MAG TPA: hypothetical protein VEJ84_04020, partial [Acidimicrobiales bacterium]|nr:hypothetical protein [Acidimicrobiales bacterium]